MIDLGPHAVFIVWAYIGVTAAVLALIAYTLLDAHRIQGRLEGLEAKGIRRRSAGPTD